MNTSLLVNHYQTKIDLSAFECLHSYVYSFRFIPGFIPNSHRQTLMQRAAPSRRC